MTDDANDSAEFQRQLAELDALHKGLADGVAASILNLKNDEAGLDAAQQQRSREERLKFAPVVAALRNARHDLESAHALMVRAFAGIRHSIVTARRLTRGDE